jgi:hypothetical protein
VQEITVDLRPNPVLPWDTHPLFEPSLFTDSNYWVRFCYEHGAASLLNLLDAERSYPSTELGYRQALAMDTTALDNYARPQARATLNSG